MQACKSFIALATDWQESPDVPMCPKTKRENHRDIQKSLSSDQIDNLEMSAEADET